MSSVGRNNSDVMAGLVPATHALLACHRLDARYKILH